MTYIAFACYSTSIRNYSTGYVYAEKGQEMQWIKYARSL